VRKADLIDADPATQYLRSYYWAYQTLTSVGFGDISSLSNYMIEEPMAIIWMLFGVGV
jgi:hypothetical protein